MLAFFVWIISSPIAFGVKNPYGYGPKGGVRPRVASYSNPSCRSKPIQVSAVSLNDCLDGLNQLLQEAQDLEMLQAHAPAVNWFFDLIVESHQGLSDEEKKQKIREYISKLPEELQQRLRTIGEYLETQECRTDILYFLADDQPAKDDEELLIDPPANPQNQTHSTTPTNPHLDFAATFPPTPYEVRVVIGHGAGCRTPNT